jgi:hypothetical protein
MSFSISVSFSGMTLDEKQKTLDELTQICLIHQDTMATYYEEQQFLEKKQQKYQKIKEAKLKERTDAENHHQKYVKEIIENEKRWKKYNNSVNWVKKNKRS